MAEAWSLRAEENLFCSAEGFDKTDQCCASSRALEKVSGSWSPQAPNLRRTIAGVRLPSVAFRAFLNLV